MPPRIARRNTKPAEKPEEGKLYWVQLHGEKPPRWHISEFVGGLWYIPTDIAPWAAVKKFIPGPEAPCE